MKFYTILSALALCLVSCGGGKTEGIMTLDLEAAIDNPRVFDFAEIVRDIQFIPLDESVPVGEIGNRAGLQPAGNGFYIADAGSSSPVQQFDADGKFVGTVGRIGRGPGETNYIVSVSPNPETGEIYVDGTSRIIGLDRGGKEFARAEGFISWGMMWYGDRLLTLPVAPPWEEEVYARDTIPFIDMYDRELKLLGSLYGPNVGPGVSMRGESFPPVMSDNGERLLVKQSRGDTLYNYTAGTISPVYALDLGRYAHTDPEAAWSIESNYLVDNVWEGERWLIFSVNNGAEEGRKPGRLVFDRRDLSGGGFSTLGPEREPGLFFDGVKFWPAYIRDNRLVGYMQAFDIVDNTDRITDTRLKAIAASLKEDSNPVIVIAELN
jgi:hypothetical protein